MTVTGCSAKPDSPADEDGSNLWLRYAALPPSRAADLRHHIRQLVVPGHSATCTIIRDELTRALTRLLGREIPFATEPTTDGALIVRISPSPSPSPGTPGEGRGEGFAIRTNQVNNHRAIVIDSDSDIGALYGVFHFLRLLHSPPEISNLNISQHPAYPLRLLNHWDNLDGTIERGYAGQSLWRWDDLPATISPRYKDYARAAASIGINGAVLNNVNASAQFLSIDYLRKVAAIANVFRPYGIRVYLSANFASPKILGDLDTADPLDPRVAAWWRDKTNEIYATIPDFGGLLVKANSEGQPGPHDYNRTHADGANVLADALKPHGGTLFWRAFVYDAEGDESVDPDRAKRAYIEFTKLDGKFRDNVILQVKNGPIDFQPREPFHPLFGAMQRTRAAAELQITQEYLGHSNHLVYLAPMWKEVLDADTFAKGQGTAVAKTISAICGVANTGSDANWTGHHFAQSNWYAFGRIAWDPSLSADSIADEWLRQTFINDDDRTLATLRSMMLDSWESFVSYTMPLGLHHLIAGNHYAVAPWNDRSRREDWTATYYHRADEHGIGFDRSPTGSAACDQYFAPVRDQFATLEKCPEKLLLWFHHVPWTHRLSTGRTLWDQLCHDYNAGYESAERMRATWRSLEGQIDPQRHREIAAKLEIQSTDARRWRDQCILYFHRRSKQPLPTWPTPIDPTALPAQPTAEPHRL